MGRQTIIAWHGMPFDWSEQDVVVVASGPSARATDFSFIHRCARVIAVNNSWCLVPWADVLYGSDGKWWTINEGVPEFTGRKFTSSPYVAQRYGMDVVYTTGNNSGLRAIHLAHKLNARRIMLIGFDMHNRDGSHWHAPHAKDLYNPSKESMLIWRMETVKAAHTKLSAAKIINCTPGSELKCFPQMSLEEALNGNDAMDCRADQSRHTIAS
jgi:hypothetical protein